MTLQEVRDLCIGLPSATEQIQWGDNLVFKVAGKMFCVTDTNPTGRYSFKCEEILFDHYCDKKGVFPAPYLARAKWVQIEPAECELDDKELRELIQRSYELVVAKLPKKTQESLKE